jgi:hypothetical protein
MLHNAADVSRFERDKVTGDQSRITMTDAEYIPPTIDPGSDYGSDRGIHPRSVATAGQNGDPFHVGLPQVKIGRRESERIKVFNSAAQCNWLNLGNPIMKGAGNDQTVKDRKYHTSFVGRSSVDPTNRRRYTDRRLLSGREFPFD